MKLHSRSLNNTIFTSNKIMCCSKLRYIRTFELVLGRTWFGSEVRSVFWGSVGSRFGFWGPTRGSVGSRFGFDRKNSKNHQFFLILFSKVRGSVRFLGGSVGSRFDFKEQIRGSVGSRFDFWRFGRFEVRYFKVRPNTNFNKPESYCK